MENKAAFKIAARLFTRCLPAVCETPPPLKKREGGKGWDVFFTSIHLLFCLISAAFLFSIESGEKHRGVRVSSSLFLVSSAQLLTQGGDDLREDVQGGEPESPSLTSGGKFICLHLSCPIYLHSGWQVA